MNQVKKYLAGRVFLLAVFALLGASQASAQIPPDPKPTCVVTKEVFASWFQSGSPSLNGVVNPANSVTFPNTPNCSFYQWSQQMFLWLTSPAPATYGGGGGRVFDSPVFYDVTAPDSSGNRYFIPHIQGQIRPLNLRTPKVGPHGLPVVFDKSGRMLEVEPSHTAPSGNQLIRDSSGNLVEVGRVTLGANKKPAFLDPAGKPIQPLFAPKPAAAAAKKGAKTRLTVQRFIVGGFPVFVDPSGNVLDVEEGQAGGGGVLIAQNGSLIYYATMVNDVFAYFLTGAKNNVIKPGTQFPTTAAELKQITDYAATFGVTFPDANALAVEIKTAWIEAAGLPNPGDYITMTATIPVYDKSNPSLWTPATQKTTQLALIGMHVVGSTAGHPEMVWATFEHVGNAPNASYQYINTSNQTITVPQNTAGKWLLTGASSTAPFNVQNAQASCGNIYGVPPTVSNCPPPAPTAKIGPTSVLRMKPFGASSDLAPNPIDGSVAASNTEIISIDHSIASMMPSGDVRNNYFMTGATWTIGGAAPTGPFGTVGTVNPGVPGNEVGTSALANTTMETFHQGANSTSTGGGFNCFACHQTNTTSVSHIYGALQPLPTGLLKPLAPALKVQK